MIGDRIREYRIKAGLKQKELARIIGVSAAAISQFESGKSKPSVDTLDKVATALGISADYLYSGNIDDSIRSLAGMRIKEAREEQKISIDKLAAISHIDASTIMAFESSSVAPDEDDLEKLADALDLPVYYFTATAPNSRFKTPNDFRDRQRFEDGLEATIALLREAYHDSLKDSKDYGRSTRIHAGDDSFVLYSDDFDLIHNTLINILPSIVDIIRTYQSAQEKQIKARDNESIFVSKILDYLMQKKETSGDDSYQISMDELEQRFIRQDTFQDLSYNQKKKALQRTVEIFNGLKSSKKTQKAIAPWSVSNGKK